ncbi:MAG: hypothetical protein IT462_07775 [Planctomycetes bacterium]|nr:hypothetical protein [Planctomycetota bacterium]
MPDSDYRQPTTDYALWKQLVVGAATGAIIGAVLLVATTLSPLAALDRRALALVCVSLAVPVGAMLAFAPANLRQAGLPAFRALAGGLALALVVVAADPRLALALALWLCPAMMIGASLGSLDKRGIAGLIAAGCWLALCAAPFFFQVFEDTSYGVGSRWWALQGCPWLGFAQSHLSLDPSRPLDPLRQDIIYMGHWSKLTDMPANGLLSSGTLWVLAALALAAALVRHVAGPSVARHEKSQSM